MQKDNNYSWDSPFRRATVLYFWRAQEYPSDYYLSKRQIISANLNVNVQWHCAWITCQEIIKEDTVQSYVYFNLCLKARA